MHLEVKLGDLAFRLGEKASLLSRLAELKRRNGTVVCVWIEEARNGLCVNKPLFTQEISLCQVCLTINVCVAQVLSCISAVVYDEEGCYPITVNFRIVLHSHSVYVRAVPVIRLIASRCQALIGSELAQQIA